MTGERPRWIGTIGPRGETLRQFWLAVCALAIYALSANYPFATATPADAAPQIDTVTIGFQGKYKLGFWTQLEVGVSQDDPTAKLEVTVLDGDGVPCTYQSESHPATAARTVMIKTGRPDTPFHVCLRTSDKVLVERIFRAEELPAPLPSTQELFLALFAEDQDLIGTLPQPREEALRAQIASFPWANSEAAIAKQTNTLPTNVLAYDAVDGILINMSDSHVAEVSKLLDKTPILAWAYQGGKLVCCVPVAGQKLFDSQLKLLRFGQFAPPRVLHKAVALEQYATIPHREELGESLGEKTLDLSVPQLTKVVGKIEAFEGVRPTDMPLVTRRAFGFGEAVLIPFAWNASPIADWKGRGYLFSRLFRRTVKPAEKGADTTDVSQTQAGYSDLEGQLRSALDQYPDVTPFSFWMFALLLTGYLALIGPLDYFVVHRVLRKMRVAWLTLPLSIGLFCGLAYVLATWSKGSVPHVHQVDLIDVNLDDHINVNLDDYIDVNLDDPADAWKEYPRERRISWFTIFSPRNELLQLSYHTGDGPWPSRLEWLGLSGSGLGGMHQASVETWNSAPQGYTLTLPQSSTENNSQVSGNAQSQSGGLAHFPVPVSSSRALVANSIQQVTQPPTLNLRRIGEGKLAGTLTAGPRSALEECVLFYDKSYWLIGRLEPGHPYQLDERREPAGWEAYLNRRALHADKITATPYDPFDTNPRRILDMMLLYEASGGHAYVGLGNRSQRRLDQSEQLELGRAVLIGRAEQTALPLITYGPPVTQLHDPHHTFVRYVFNVSDKPEPQ